MRSITKALGLTTVGISICVAVLLFEIGLQYRRRDLFPPPVPEATILFRKSADPVLIYEMTPSTETSVNGVRYATNRDGFRDDEFPDAPGGVEKLLVIGDSVAMGLGVPMEDSFPWVLETLLSKGDSDSALSPPPVVYNLAVAGYSTAQEIRLLETSGLALKPSRILWSYVLNDPDTVDGGLAFYFSAPRIELLRIAAAAMSKSTHLINNYRKATSLKHDYYQFIHERYAEKTEAQFARLGEIQRQTGVPIDIIVSPVFGYVPGESYPWADIDARIRDLAVGNELGFLDLFDVLGKHPWQEVLQDELHPTTKGHRLMAETVFGYLSGDRGFKQ
ncbi:MAG: SGNH/GDSL hydrolase family protein [Acidobacteria bacterium]|nr:SGNH/GDSL hydrolase family protein [Acidobacteriota bacterium]